MVQLLMGYRAGLSLFLDLFLYGAESLSVVSKGHTSGGRKCNEKDWVSQRPDFEPPEIEANIIPSLLKLKP